MDAIILVSTDPWESNKLFGGFGEGSYKSKIKVAWNFEPIRRSDKGQGLGSKMSASFSSIRSGN